VLGARWCPSGRRRSCGSLASASGDRERARSSPGTVRPPHLRHGECRPHGGSSSLMTSPWASQSAAAATWVAGARQRTNPRRAR
jgi:hypothetical protein